MFGDYSSNNFNNLDYNGTPIYVPIPVSGSIPPQAPGIIVASGFSSLNDIQNQFIANSGLFQQVGNMLDRAGSTMKLCNTAPASIQTRIMRQIQPGESCWNLYKRMLNVTMQYPEVNPYSQPTLAEQMTSNGNNDILTNPMPNGLPNSFDQNPGGVNLLIMLFLAILPAIVNAIYNIILAYPIKWISNGVTNLYNSLIGGTSVVAGQVAAASIQTTADNATTAGPPPQASSNILTTAATVAGNLVVKALIAAGPKLNVNVEKYDALLISNYMQEMARSSLELTWPEAVMLLPQYLGLLNQQNSSVNAIGYYSTNSLSSRPGQSNVPSEISTIFGIQNTYIQSGLNRMVSAFSYTVLDNTVCCLIKILGSFNTKFLNTILAILQLSQNRQGIMLQSLDSTLNNLWASIQKAILSTLLSILYNLMGEINGAIVPVLQTPPNTSSMSCGSWQLFSTNLLQFIGNIEISVLGMASEFVNSLKFQDNYQTAYVNQLQQSGYIKVLYNLIQIIQSALNAGALCNSSNIPTNLEIQNLLNSLPPGVTITGQIPIQNNLAAPNIPPVKILTSCMNNVPPEEIAMVESWIKALQGQS